MRRPTPALVLSVVALTVASAGTAAAATKYLITSTHQIAPSVLAKLKGSRGPAGADAVVARTRINYNSGGQATYQTDGFAQLVDLGSFVKHQSKTALTINLDELGASGNLQSTCLLQLRVDGVNDLGQTSFSGTDGVVVATDPSTVIPVFMQAVFTGISKGTHDLSVWGNTSDSSYFCGEDAGGFERSAFVIETR